VLRAWLACFEFIITGGDPSIPSILVLYPTNTHSYNAILPIGPSVVAIGEKDKKMQDMNDITLLQLLGTRTNLPLIACDRVTLHHAIFRLNEVHGEVCCKGPSPKRPLT